MIYYDSNQLLIEDFSFGVLKYQPHDQDFARGRQTRTGVTFEDLLSRILG